MAINVKKGDTVVVISGKDRSKDHKKVVQVIPDKSQVVVEGVNVVKKHERPSQQNQTGGIVEKEMPIHISNVMVVDPKTGEPTRIKRKREAGKPSVRVAVKSGNELD